jgi:hypothetical protein
MEYLYGVKSSNLLIWCQVIKSTYVAYDLIRLALILNNSMSGSDIYKWNSIPNKKIKSMDLDVKVVESSFVAPSATTPRKALWLSSLDCSFANRGHTSTIYFYPSTEGRTVNFSDVTNRLKGVLGQGLGGFLPSRCPP